MRELLKLAIDMDAFIYNHNTYEYWDVYGEEHETCITNIFKQLMAGCKEGFVKFLQDIIDYSDIPEEKAEAKKLISRIEGGQVL